MSNADTLKSRLEVKVGIKKAWSHSISFIKIPRETETFLKKKNESTNASEYIKKLEIVSKLSLLKSDIQYMCLSLTNEKPCCGILDSRMTS
ncbi:UNVERIFIED_CONTAM: hypothetical protein NCL1_07501 [Trichonephila clavipes]